VRNFLKGTNGNVMNTILAGIICIISEKYFSPAIFPILDTRNIPFLGF